jgi:hypothetical protein
MLYFIFLYFSSLERGWNEKSDEKWNFNENFFLRCCRYFSRGSLYFAIFETLLSFTQHAYEVVYFVFIFIQFLLLGKHSTEREGKGSNSSYIRL